MLTELATKEHNTSKNVQLLRNILNGNHHSFRQNTTDIVTAVKS